MQTLSSHYDISKISADISANSGNNNYFFYFYNSMSYLSIATPSKQNFNNDSTTRLPQ